MQTIVQPPAGPGATPPVPTGLSTPVPPANGSDDEDLQLLLDWARNPDETDRLRKAAIGTVAVHLILIFGLIGMPWQSVRPLNRPERERQVTHLYDPPLELTQK